MFWSTFSSDCAISEMRASRAVWKGVVGGEFGGRRVDAIFFPFGWRQGSGECRTAGGGGFAWRLIEGEKG